MEVWHDPSYIFLMVNEFGVKYVGKEHVTLIVEVLQQYYEISID